MSPKIGTVQGAAIRVIWWEIQLKIETNPCSPRIGTVRETASNFEGVFRHFVMNLSDCFWLQATVYVHGRDNQSFPPSLVHKEWLNLALTFSAAALRGSPHSSHNQKQIQISLMVRRAGLSRPTHPKSNQPDLFPFFSLIFFNLFFIFPPLYFQPTFLFLPLLFFNFYNDFFYPHFFLTHFFFNF